MPGCGLHSGPKLALVARNPDKPTLNKFKINKQKQTKQEQKNLIFDHKIRTIEGLLISNMKSVYF